MNTLTRLGLTLVTGLLALAISGGSASAYIPGTLYEGYGPTAQAAESAAFASAYADSQVGCRLYTVTHSGTPAVYDAIVTCPE